MATAAAVDSKIRPIAPVPNETLSDLGNAERLVRYFGHGIRYVRPWKQWLCWDDRRWAEDRDGQVELMAKDTVRQIYNEAMRATDTGERKRLFDHALKSESVQRIKAMITLAETEPDVALLPEDFDKNPMLVNVLNGTIDLSTGNLLDHDPDHLITKLAHVQYDPDAQCPQFVEFMGRIMAGNRERIAYVQDAIGYSLTGDTREQVLFMAYGTGANGKSTLLEHVLAPLLGDYATKADFSTFLAGNDSTGQGARPDIARLVGARCVWATEADKGQRLSESRVKELTGGDTITARMLYSAPFEFRPQFKLWLVANHKPVIRDNSHAMWRRIHLIPFTVTIPDSERDTKLPEKLQRELPGILNWALEGARRWMACGLVAPKDIRSATSEYRAEMDTLGDFIEAKCELSELSVVSAAELYREYREWSEQNGYKPMSMTAFGTSLSERDITKDKNGPGNSVRRIGIALKKVNWRTQSDSPTV